MFRTARQNRIFQDVVDQIQEAILDGRLNDGDMLPAERELKDIFKTSRGTLREALRVLEQKGLIEIRLGVGGGAVIKSATTDQVSESLALLIRSQKVSLNHLAQFREGIEGNVAVLAAQQACQNDIQRLKQLLAQAQSCAQAGTSQRQAFLDADKQIHLTIAQISKNPLYICILQTVHDNIHCYYERFLAMDAGELKDNYDDLENIVHAIEQHDAALARDLLQSHVRRFNRYMKKSARKEKPEPKFDQKAAIPLPVDRPGLR